MELKYSGKTKDVYELADGNYLLKFKDDVTGEDGVFDPGANTVGLQIEGAGKAGLRMSQYFFDILKKAHIPTHYIEANVDEATMVVKPATPFGEGLEVICRYRAVGSFLRRYEKYVTEGQPLDAFVEVTLKDDERQDPPISKDALAMIGVMTEKEYEELKTLTQTISGMVKEELAGFGLELYDIKLEFGRLADGTVALIDEISGGNMRVYEQGEYIDPISLSQRLFEPKR